MILATTETPGDSSSRRWVKPISNRSWYVPWNDAYRLRGGPVHNGAIYCPADGTVYIDLSFYDDMKENLARMAILPRGTLSPMKSVTCAETVRHRAESSSTATKRDQAEVNRLSVRMELQADCFAGSGGIVCSSKAFWKPAIWKRPERGAGHRR